MYLLAQYYEILLTVQFKKEYTFYFTLDSLMLKKNKKKSPVQKRISEEQASPAIMSIY